MFTYNEVQLVNVNISKAKKWLGYAVMPQSKSLFWLFYTSHLETIAVLKLDDELEYLENLVKENKKNNTKKYNENKLRYIPKADIEMMREDRYEKTGNKNQKKYK